MRTAPVLLRDAVALGLADPADVLAGRTVLVPQWRSNRVHRLEGAGSVLAYVKQPGPASVLDGDDTVAVERAAWEALRGRVLLPRVLGDPGPGGTGPGGADVAAVLPGVGILADGVGGGEVGAVVRGDTDAGDASVQDLGTALRGNAVAQGGVPPCHGTTVVRGNAVAPEVGREETAVRGDAVLEDASPGDAGTVVRGDAVARGAAGEEVVGAAVRGDPAARHTLGGDAVWTAPLPGVPLEELRGQPSWLGVASSALGQELARLHAVPAGPGTVAARLPWPLHPDRLLPSMAGAPEGSPSAGVLAAVREPALAAALAAAARGWRREVWVHGDLTAGNVVVDGDRTGLLDWEAGGAGDPDWDVVCAASALHELGGAPAVERFLSGYAAAGGPGRVGTPLACVHTVVTAWQLAVQVEHLDPADPSGAPSAGVQAELAQEVATRLGRARRLATLTAAGGWSGAERPEAAGGAVPTWTA